MSKLLVVMVVSGLASVAEAQAPRPRCGTANHGSVFAAEAGVRHTRATRKIFLNKNGGTYQISNAATNAATNVANVQVSANGQPRTAVIPPITSQFDWPKVSACVKAHFAVFDIDVTETAPASGDYIEAVVGGTGTELGFPANQLFGIAAADNFCGVTERGIAFTFDVTHAQVPRKDDELCATIAHEVGHLVALEHETHAKDLMSYVLIDESMTKAFVDIASPCGVYPNQNQQCTCVATPNTNSYARLVSFLGLRNGGPVDVTPPVLALVSPGNNGQVMESFEVVATASDVDSEVQSVRVLLDGTERGSLSTPTGGEYRFQLSGVAVGTHSLQVVATDTASNEAMQTRTIEVVGSGSGSGSGSGVGSGGTSATGTTCVTDGECAGGLCAMSEDGNYCSEHCQVANDSCPDGFECADIGGPQVCVQQTEGGCCSTSRGGFAATGLLGLLVGLALVVPRRRRRHV